jgi:hypothetical protein
VRAGGCSEDVVDVVDVVGVEEGCVKLIVEAGEGGWCSAPERGDRSDRNGALEASVVELRLVTA